MAQRRCSPWAPYVTSGNASLYLGLRCAHPPGKLHTSTRSSRALMPILCQHSQALGAHAQDQLVAVDSELDFERVCSYGGLG
jgi:hypothetical protein